MATVETQPVSLEKSGALYTFTPGDGVVFVTYAGPWRSWRRVMPTSEARELWESLRAQGYERF